VTSSPAGDETVFTREEYEVLKGAVRLALYRKRPKQAGATERTGPSGRTVVFVHGSSLAALPTFDLTVPGRTDYSMMDWFARRGYDAWTLDHEGYGASSLTDSNADIAAGVADLAAALPIILERSGSRTACVYGMSSGSLRAGAFAAAHPDLVERVALDAFVWTGEGSPTLAKRKEGAAQFRARNRRPIDLDFVRSIFTRDAPGTTDDAVADACAQAQLAYGDSVPTGTYLDMTQHLPLVDPTALRVPTLIVRGEHDGIATDDDLLAFFRLLATSEKSFVMLAGLAHCTPLGIERHKMWRTVDAFFGSGP
jgi:non-heme chloroperoxidase